jgi:Xaa-Pro aminopeptidase
MDCAKDASSALEEVRTLELLAAQTKAAQLFQAVKTRELIRPGITESRLNEDIYALAKEMYGITTYWHKRIVRAGANTLLPYAENPPDLTLGEDDILFLDLGPVFEAWEADFGRTFVLGPTHANTNCETMSAARLLQASSISKIIRRSSAVNSIAMPNRSRRNLDGSLAD